MSPQNARIAVLPREVTIEVITGAVSRAGWAVSIAILVLNSVVLVDIIGPRSGVDALVPPLVATAGMFGLLLFFGLRTSTRTRVLFLAGGGVLSTAYSVSLLVVDPSLNDVAAHLLNRPAFVLVIALAGIRRPLQGLLWGAIGFGVAMVSIVGAELIAGVPVAPGWGPVVAFAMYASAYIALAGIRHSQRTTLPDLARLEEETRRLALEDQYELRAAALIHDTVLSDLTAVMNTTGRLDERARERFRADVATLSDASWLRESKEALEIDPQDAALRNGMVALVSELQWRGLTVDVTGDPVSEVVRLSPEKVSAVHAAVRACLENVLQHAQTGAAELVLGADGDSASVMIIDQGVGFDPATVPADRLGLRASIRGRIEALGGSVKVWSKPGSGTSIMLTMPVGHEGVSRADS